MSLDPFGDITANSGDFSLDKVAEESDQEIDYEQDSSHSKGINDKLCGRENNGDNENDMEVNETGITTHVEAHNDLENITFRDNYYRDLLNETIEDNESFEVLPSFRDFNPNGDFINIENTINDSETDNRDSTDEDKHYGDKHIYVGDSKRRAQSFDSSKIKPLEEQPVITVSGSKGTILVNKGSTESTKLKGILRRTCSLSDLLTDNNKKNRKKKIASKLYRSGSVSNIIEDDYLEDKVKCLSHKHWFIVLNNSWTVVLLLAPFVRC